MTKILRHLMRRAVDASHRGGTFRGIYRDFAEAERAVPKIKPVGYNHAELGTWYRYKIDTIADDDYPALFWMSKAFRDSKTVFEVGGHVGVAYHAFQSYTEYPDDLRWEICEVPAIVDAGRKLASERGSKNVSFVTSHEESEGGDVVLAVGSLQYIESPGIGEMIAGFRTKPKHVIINKTPVWDGATFITLQSIGYSCCPYIVRNREQFVKSIEREGYRLRDSWKKKRKLQVTFRPGTKLEHYSGFYFERHG